MMEEFYKAVADPIHWYNRNIVVWDNKSGYSPKLATPNDINRALTTIVEYFSGITGYPTPGLLEIANTYSPTYVKF